MDEKDIYSRRAVSGDLDERQLEQVRKVIAEAEQFHASLDAPPPAGSMFDWLRSLGGVPRLVDDGRSAQIVFDVPHRVGPASKLVCEFANDPENSSWALWNVDDDGGAMLADCIPSRADVLTLLQALGVKVPDGV